MNEGLDDVVARALDGGIRFGSLIDKDMVALEVRRDQRCRSAAIAGGRRG